MLLGSGLFLGLLFLVGDWNLVASVWVLADESRFRELGAFAWFHGRAFVTDLLLEWRNLLGHLRLIILLINNCRSNETTSHRSRRLLLILELRWLFGQHLSRHREFDLVVLLGRELWTHDRLLELRDILIPSVRLVEFQWHQILLTNRVEVWFLSLTKYFGLRIFDKVSDLIFLLLKLFLEMLELIFVLLSE